MQTGAVGSHEATTFRRTYPGAASHIRRVRADLARVVGGYPIADDLVLVASELGANAARHSKSGAPGGEFTVRAWMHPGDYAWLEVEDQGGPWASKPRDDDDHPHGLDIVARLAGDDNWGIDGGPDWRVVWVRLDWPGDS